MDGGASAESKRAGEWEIVGEALREREIRLSAGGEPVRAEDGSRAGGGRRKLESFGDLIFFTAEGIGSGSIDIMYSRL